VTPREADQREVRESKEALRLMRKILTTRKSKEYFDRAKQSLVGGIANALYKAEYEEFPIYIERGKGSKVYGNPSDSVPTL
jgi:hypothetical protein